MTKGDIILKSTQKEVNVEVGDVPYRIVLREWDGTKFVVHTMFDPLYEKPYFQWGHYRDSPFEALSKFMEKCKDQEVVPILEGGNKIECRACDS